jgi:adenine specific DNA methylase Mod
LINRTKTLKGEAKRFHVSTENLLFYAKNCDIVLFNGFRKPKEKPTWVKMHLPGTVKGKAWRIIFGKKLYPPKGRKWVLSQEAIDKAIEEGLIKFNERINEPLFLTKWTTIGSNWTDIQGYSKNWGFPTENSEEILQRVIEASSNPGDLVMDFFLGSGTTTAVAHKLGRKWIGIEMGNLSARDKNEDFFYRITLNRMKKVLAGDSSGISKEIGWNGGGFFKYYELTQYEDTLRKVKYAKESPLFNPQNSNSLIFGADLKLLEVLELDYNKNIVKVNLAKLYKNIDIIETISNLLGKWIARISDDYVEFKDGERVNVKNLDYRIIKPLIWWE